MATGQPWKFAPSCGIKINSESSENFLEEIFRDTVCALTSYKWQCCMKKKQILVYLAILISSKLLSCLFLYRSYLLLFTKRQY